MMAIPKARLENGNLDPSIERRKGILLNPQPGEIWAAIVGHEAIAYGKTRKEAYDRARQIRPDVEPVMDLIAWLWDIGFFDSEDKGPRAVWI
jgi:hypothetical protein